MTTLKSMTAYVLDQIPKDKKDNLLAESEKLKYIFKYAKFLSMPLELKMFVPVDSENNVLEYPKTPHTFASENADEYIKKWNKEKDVYAKAKSEVIFEGFKINYTNESGSFEIVDSNDVQVYYYKSIPKYGLWLGSQKEKTIEHMITYNRTLTPQAIEKYKF